jgi:hypothetical protein
VQLNEGYPQSSVITVQLNEGYSQSSVSTMQLNEGYSQSSVSTMHLLYNSDLPGSEQKIPARV